MTSAWLANNVIAWSLQAALLILIGAAACRLIRFQTGRYRLLFLQSVLLTCLALPLIQPWRTAPAPASIPLSEEILFPDSSPPPPAQSHGRSTLVETAILLMAAGAALRMIYLGFGFIRLRSYRRNGVPWRLARHEDAIYNPDRVPLLLTTKIAVPVTFGWRNPVVLLPGNFEFMDRAVQEAILCHELLHVERRDWLVTVAEEVLCSLLWFHPGIWWMMSEIRLAREQAVDETVVETTGNRESYVGALLAMAGLTNGAALMPATGFLRRSHLRRRLKEVLKECDMKAFSNVRLAFSAGAALAVVAVAAWVVSAAFPLTAATVADSPGVQVNLLDSQLVHGSRIVYPASALAGGVGGTVGVQLKLNANAEVVDATIVSGPDELRKSVLQAVLTWHLDRSLANSTQMVTVVFAKPEAAALTASAPPPPPPPPPPPAPSAQQNSNRLEAIVVTGISDAARGDLFSRLPIHVGDEVTPSVNADVKKIAAEIDSHLAVTVFRRPTGAFELRISPINGSVAQVTPPANTTGEVYSVGGDVSAPALISKVDPQMSDEARAAKFSGSVKLSFVVGVDGVAGSIVVVDSAGMGLDEKAVEAVQQWRFRPATKNGTPVAVRATADVNFRML